MARILIHCVVAILLRSGATGEGVAPAIEKMYHSANGKYGFVVVPRLQNFRLEGMREREGTDPDLPLLHGSPRFCYGTFFEGGGGQYRAVWRAKLVNEVAPDRVEFSPGGRFVVTLDNWEGVGSGAVVAIYGEKGRFIRKFTLEEIFSADEVEFLTRRDPMNAYRSGSPWLNKLRFDATGNILILELRTHRDARIELASGTLMKNVE